MNTTFKGQRERGRHIPEPSGVNSRSINTTQTLTSGPKNNRTRTTDTENSCQSTTHPSPITSCTDMSQTINQDTLAKEAFRSQEYNYFLNKCCIKKMTVSITAISKYSCFLFSSIGTYCWGLDGMFTSWFDQCINIYSTKASWIYISVHSSRFKGSSQKLVSTPPLSSAGSAFTCHC